MKHSKGFTLIELVVVITILGILAAVALPRFVNLQGDARVSKLNAARGAVQAAAAMVYGAAQARTNIVQPVCPGTGATPNVTAAGGGNICTQSGLVNVVNWNAQANLLGIIAAAGLTSVSPPTAAALAAEGYGLVGAGGAAIGSTITVTVVGGTSAATCSFTYTPSLAGAAGSAAQVSAVTIAGCY